MGERTGLVCRRRYGDRVPILRDDDPRIAWLALPLAGLAGFILFALVAAAVGLSAGASGAIGLGGTVVGMVAAAMMLRRE